MISFEASRIFGLLHLHLLKSRYHVLTVVVFYHLYYIVKIFFYRKQATELLHF